MSGYKTFAVAGAGNIGKFIIDALLEKHAAGVITSVTLLTRSVSPDPAVSHFLCNLYWQKIIFQSKGNNEYITKGVKLSTVDYESPSSIEAALSGIDVVLSTISRFALGVQDNLAAGAKAAGVKLFVASEYGNKPDDRDSQFGKDDIYNKLKELGLPYTAFYTGRFTDMVMEP